MSWQKSLDERVARALRFLGPEPKDWVVPSPGIDHNVLIVGGGQGGLANAFALRRAGIGGVSIVDAAEPGAAGVWLDRARMHTLRTAKTVTGPEFGIPELSFQSWHEAQHGAEAFQALDFIGREDWGRYLHWFEKATGAKVRHGTRLLRIEPFGRHLRAHLEVDGVERTETARNIIIVTGIEGCGVPNRLPIVTDNLPSHLYSHTADQIDFGAFAGKTVAVVGAGASALDAAAVALEQGAADVHLLSRRDHIPSGGPAGTRNHFGSYENFDSVPDRFRWKLAVLSTLGGSTPPVNALHRLKPFTNFHIHLGAPIEAARAEGEQVHLQTASSALTVDHVILGTGYTYDPLLQDFLSPVADKIAVWSDRYTPPADLQNPVLGRYPYLGPAYEFTGKVPGTAPYLGNIHCLSKSGMVSFARPVGDIPSLQSGVRAIVSAISHKLYFEDEQVHEALLLARGKPAITPDLYEAAIWRPLENVAAAE